MLIGHADPSGPTNYNTVLARERAERVKEHLVAHGLRADRIVVRSAAESAPPSESSVSPRRVEVLVLEAGVSDERPADSR
jgi:outer membrane protein OmpA-like peptidoglycan-associated protein